MKIVLSGIGTEVGKTIVSSIFCQAFELNYWKPIQSGAKEDNDSRTVEHFATNAKKIFPNSFCFQEPLSPDQAAKLEGVKIDVNKINVPDSDKLLIEPAGGLMVPLTEDGILFSDLLKKWNFPVILVSRFYLGSINHTLLSIDFLKNNGIELAGVVFTGEMNPESETIIRKKAGDIHYHFIPWNSFISKDFILEQAERLKEESTFQQLFS
jgi:dethiobiotin synthetase